MTIAPFSLVRPRSIDEAQAEVAAAPERRVLRGGGVDLIDHLKEGLITPERVVDLRHVEDPTLRSITLGPKGEFTVGAMTSLASVAETLDADAGAQVTLAALQRAAQGAATPNIRNAATVGGNLLQRPRCWYYRNRELVCLKKGGSTCLAVSGDNRYHAIFGGGPSYIVHPSSLASALSALGAEVDVRGVDGKERTLPIPELFVAPGQDVMREHVLAPGEVLMRVRVPAQADRRSWYQAAREKQSFDWPLVEASVSLRLSGGKMTDVRVVLGHVAPIPWRSQAAESVLEGKKPSEALFASAGDAAVSDARPLANNAYKIPMARGLLRHALHRAANLPLPE
jgi:xanthine dehydrogenase YagS FAD-binding subunit